MFGDVYTRRVIRAVVIVSSESISSQGGGVRRTLPSLRGRALWLQAGRVVHASVYWRPAVTYSRDYWARRHSLAG